MSTPDCTSGTYFEQVGRQSGVFVGPNVELSGRRRQDARPGLAKMHRVPPDRAWWPAVGAPLERGVRRLSSAAFLRPLHAGARGAVAGDPSVGESRHSFTGICCVTPQTGRWQRSRIAGVFPHQCPCASPIRTLLEPHPSHAHKAFIKRSCSLGAAWEPSARRCLTLRSSGAPTAGRQARSGGTRYIFASPGLASCRRRPLSSNVRPHREAPCRM